MAEPVVSRLELFGEYDLNQKAELASLFRAIPADVPLVVDLTKVTYVDSSFLHELSALRRRFNEQPVTLLGASRGMLRLLHLVGFDKLFLLTE